MVLGTSEINKMDQSIEPSKVSSPAAEGNKLGTGDTLKDQITTPEEKMKITTEKHMIHDEQKASSTINIDNSRISRTNSMSREDASSRHLLAGVVGDLKQPTDENGVSVGMANNCKLAPSTVLSAHYVTNWVAQRPHYSMTSDETLMPLQDFATSDPGNRFCKNYPNIEKNCGNIFSTILLNRIEGPGVTENIFKGKGTHAVGATADADCKAEAFNGESSNDTKSQGRIISATVDVNPGVEKDESLPPAKPTKGAGRSSTKDKSISDSAPPKKLRKCEASVLTGPNLHNKPSDITGETDDDHEELLVAAGSVHSARENACSFPFWKAMESFFVPVTSQNIFFLQQELNFVENLTRSQIFGDDCDRAGGYTRSSPRRAVSNSDQQSITSTAFGRSNKPSNAVPTLVQRVFSALVDEDGGSDRHCCSNKGASSSTYGTGSVSSTFSNQGKLQADDGLSYSTAEILHGNNQNDPILTHASQVNARPVFPFNCPYQMLSPNDKLSLELQGIGLNAPLLGSREGWIDREIKRLRGELWQKVSTVKNNLRKIQKAIICEQGLEKRNLEESAMDQLVEMAYKRMFQVGRRSKKSSRIGKVSEQAALPFVKRTLAKCKQFEDSGKSIFSQHAQLNSILYKLPIEKDARPIECDGSMILDNKCKQACDKGKRKYSEIGPVLGAIQRLDSQNNNMHGRSSGLQESSTQLVDSFIFNKWRKECLDQIVSGSFTRVTNPSQVQTGFSGAVQPPSHPISPLSGVLSTYNCMAIEGKINLLNEIAGCSLAKAMFEGRHGIINGERDSKNRDKKTALVARSASWNDYKSKANSKPKRPLSRTGLQELSRSAQSLALKTGDQTAEGNNELPSTVNASQDVSSETRSINIEQLNASDPVKILGETEDLSSLLDFDEKVLPDGDSIGLEVPMDDLSEVEMFV